jgi:hypothetical protein
MSSRHLFLLLVLLLAGEMPTMAADIKLAWDPVTFPDLAGYRLYLGASSGSYVAPLDVGKVTQYMVMGLAAGNWYFAVTAYDTHGNESGYSNEVAATVADTIPPVISSIQASIVTTGAAAVIWTTDEISDSQVEYGTTTAYGSMTPLSTSMVTTHSRSLSGLNGNTLYHYRVKSRDAAGNLATSGDCTFTTLDSVPPAISAVAIRSGTNEAVVTWNTDDSSDSQVEWGTTIAYGSATAVNSTMVSAHRQLLGGLIGGTLYHYRVKSRDAAGNLAASADYVFTTTDSAPPVISLVTGSNVADRGATITWTTDEASDSQVEYGTTTAYGSMTPVNTAMVSAHSQSLGGLTASTSYHFRVKSRDAAGNLAVSGDFTFTTSALADTTAPVVSLVTSTNVTGTGATITWATDEASDSQVEYGTTTAYGSTTPMNAAMTTAHSQSLSGLTGSTLYHYRVKSRDVAGNLATSGDFTFTTPDITPPVIAAVAGFAGAGEAVISWNTNELSDTQLEYGTTTSYGNSTPLNTTPATAHRCVLESLTPGTVYHFRVKSRDVAGNLAVSGDFTFTTLQ